MVERVFGKFFWSGPEFKYRLGRVFLKKRKAIVCNDSWTGFKLSYWNMLFRYSSIVWAIKVSTENNIIVTNFPKITKSQWCSTQRRILRGSNYPIDSFPPFTRHRVAGRPLNIPLMYSLLLWNNFQKSHMYTHTLWGVVV